jgi:hypothetical protein
MEGIVPEWEALGDGVDGHTEVGWSLSAHRGRRLDGGDISIVGLVRSGPRSDVEYPLGRTQGAFDVSSNARVGLAVQRIPPADRPVVNVASTAIVASHVWWPAAA